MNKDSIQKFIFNDANVRGEIIHLDDSFTQIIKQHDYPKDISLLLGELLAASVLLTNTLNFEGQLTIQFQGDAPLKMLVAKCNHLLQIRGVASWDEGSLPSELSKAFNEGKLVITVEDFKTEQRYQSIVDSEAGNIAQAIEGYFQQSAQLDTKIWLSSSAEKISGLLLQKLPDVKDQKDQWQHLTTLANTIKTNELDSLDNITLIKKLFFEEDIKLFNEQEIKFYCPCSIEKMQNAILLAGEKEAKEILSTNDFIEVVCEYCSNSYEFNGDDVNQLFKKH
jgi:molecular chaperone Hsp33